MMRPFKTALAVFLFSSLAVACGTDDSDGEQVCEPGKTSECMCGPNSPGIQVCRDDGSGWGECKQCCTPDCADKECGDDGCKGLCGVCQDYPNSYCTELGLCDCAVDCGGKECGDDGCAGSCGTCDEGEECDDNQQCLLQPWTDPTSGLAWQVTPTGGEMDWDAAKLHCQSLLLAGKGWHLPSISELRTLIRGCSGTIPGGTCGVTDECLGACTEDGGCSGCSVNQGPADGCYWPDEMQGLCTGYWSSSPAEGSDDVAWTVGFSYGSVVGRPVSTYPGLARCVR